MQVAPLPANEEERLNALKSYEILDTDFDKDYDDLCRMASLVCGCPITLISLIDQERQWFKAVVGLEVRETPRDIAFCSHAILQNQLFIVPDALNDPRFADNPLVTQEPQIRFYAGQPLITSDGYALGTLCAIDRVPRQLTEDQKEALRILAKQVTTNLELRLANQRWRQLNEEKDHLLTVVAHDLRSPFSGILGLLSLLAKDISQFSRSDLQTTLQSVSRSAHQVYHLVESLLEWALIKGGSISLTPETLNLEALAREASAPLEAAIQAKGQNLVFDLPPLTLVGDRRMLLAAVRNLLSNAIKFTPSGGRILVGGTQLATEVSLFVKDEGKGFPPTVLAELNHTSQRKLVSSHQGTNGERGSGLGLALVREYAVRHGGRLEVTNNPEGGSTVSLFLTNSD
ncbi:MAG: GAF domain-containing sensor histidine kinase [Spirochaetales bacterium]|nr:GAF domain-containing sensor histidine kinase [Spirochaetales bacterium]